MPFLIYSFRFIAIASGAIDANLSLYLNMSVLGGMSGVWFQNNIDICQNKTGDCYSNKLVKSLDFL